MTLALAPALQRLPGPRGPLSEALLDALTGLQPPGALPTVGPDVDP